MSWAPKLIPGPMTRIEILNHTQPGLPAITVVRLGHTVDIPEASNGDSASIAHVLMLDALGHGLWIKIIARPP